MPEPVEHLSRAALRLRGYRSRWLETSEGRLHLLEAAGGGAMPPLVLLHGLGSTGVHYGPLLKRIRPRVSRILVPDMPAHGFSERPSSGMHTAAVLRGLFEALDALLDEPAVLFGNSMGCYASVRYALSRPERVHKLVLASPAGAVGGAEELERVRDLFRIERHDEALRFVDRLLARPHPFRHVMAWGIRRRFARPELRSWVEALDPADALSADDLAALAMPVLMIWGEHERILPESHLRFWQAHLPDRARIERPPGMGHSPFLDRPRALSELVLGFLEGRP